MVGTSTSTSTAQTVCKSSALNAAAPPFDPEELSQPAEGEACGHKLDQRLLTLEVSVARVRCIRVGINLGPCRPPRKLRRFKQCSPVCVRPVRLCRQAGYHGNGSLLRPDGKLGLLLHDCSKQRVHCVRGVRGMRARMLWMLVRVPPGSTSTFTNALAVTIVFRVVRAKTLTVVVVRVRGDAPLAL